jgi:hypothetical protein
MSKKVFFLGSGFSKALDNYPTLSELSEEIIKKMSGKESIHDNYTNELLTPLKDNFEHLLTYLSSSLPWKNENQKYSDRALYSIITEKVSSLFLEKAKKTIDNSHKIYLDHKYFFDSFAKNSEDISFISLNYDLLLEILLQHSYYNQSKIPSERYYITSAKMYQFPMTWVGLRSMSTGMIFGDDNDRANPQIVKLHGSVNWFWSGTSPSETIFYKNLMEDENRVNRNIDAGLIPYIIPPVMDKNSFYNHIMIKSLWKKANELLHNADEIYIIGFSFPQTDISIRFLFQSALEGMTPTIYVVNKVGATQKCDLIKNYSQIFGNRDVNYDFCVDDDVVKKLGKFLEKNNG